LAASLRAFVDLAQEIVSQNRAKGLCGLAIVPTELGMEFTVAEIKRVVKKGARAMYIPGMPSVPYNHPTHYEPLWQAADEHGVTLCFHRNHGGPPDKTDWDFLSEDRVSIGGIVTRYFSVVRTLLIPDLRWGV
jgi:predicted TIM-barrel fold metal-dependent hydrolase